MIETILGWAAPIVTMIAAIMTASNLGARVTGWGFALFTVGSIAWGAIGVLTDQTNLIANNAFLTLVNAIGVWRWLGRQTTYEKGGKAAAQASQRSAAPTLFTATGIAGMTTFARDGDEVGKAVEALLECRAARISYVVVASRGAGGLEETLRAVPRQRIAVRSDGIHLHMTSAAFAALPALDSGDWPARPAVA